MHEFNLANLNLLKSPPFAVPDIYRQIDQSNHHSHLDALMAMGYGSSPTGSILRPCFRKDTDMIDELQASKSCFFYRQKVSITSIAITALFRAVRGAQTSPSNNFFSYIRQPQGAAIWSALCFQFDKTPAFLPGTDEVAPEDDVMVCDDLGEEWADFIGLWTNPTSPRITFYHAKHGPLSLGASSFHVSVGQAIKNLGNLSLPATAMGKKFTRWGRAYTNNRVRTGISRTCRGTAAQSQAAVEFCRNAPHTVKRVAIVTSSLSKAAVEQEFRNIEAGRTVNPYFVQLYWLLSSFFAACSEVGAFGCVICQD